MLVEPALQDREFDDIDASPHFQLAHGVRLVDLDGLNAEAQLSCYFLIAVAEGDEAQYFVFALAGLAHAGSPLAAPFATYPPTTFAVTAGSR